MFLFEISWMALLKISKHAAKLAMAVALAVDRIKTKPAHGALPWLLPAEPADAGPPPANRIKGHFRGLGLPRPSCRPDQCCDWAVNFHTIFLVEWINDSHDVISRLVE